MTNKDLSELKVEVTKESLRKYIQDLVITQETILFIKKQLAPLYMKKKEDLTEDEGQKIKRGEENIERFMEGITTSDQRIANFLTIIDAYSKDKPVKL